MPQFLVTENAAGNVPLARSDGGAILTVAQNAAQIAPLLAGSRAFTPNAESSFGPITPGGAPTPLAVADITPKTSGLLLITATFAVQSSVPDALSLALFAVAPLTAIAGGTPVGTGITADPTSTTPSFSGSPIMSGIGVESTLGGDNATVSVTATYQATVGQRTGIVATGLSAVGGATTWTVGFTLSVIEV